MTGFTASACSPYVAARAAALADDRRRPGVFLASATMSSSVCALCTISGPDDLVVGGLARVRHLPAVHLLVDQRQQRVERRRPRRAMPCSEVHLCDPKPSFE